MAVAEIGPWAYVDNIYTWFYLCPSTSKGIFLLSKWNDKAILELKFDLIFFIKILKLVRFLRKISMVTKLYTSFHPSIPKLDKRFWVTTQVRSSIFYVSSFSIYKTKIWFFAPCLKSFISKEQKKTVWMSQDAGQTISFLSLRMSKCIPVFHTLTSKKRLRNS